MYTCFHHTLIFKGDLLHLRRNMFNVLWKSFETIGTHDFRVRRVYVRTSFSKMTLTGPLARSYKDQVIYRGDIIRRRLLKLKKIALMNPSRIYGIALFLCTGNRMCSLEAFSCFSFMHSNHCQTKARLSCKHTNAPFIGRISTAKIRLSYQCQDTSWFMSTVKT